MKLLTSLLSMLAGTSGSTRGRSMLRLVGAFVLAVVAFSVGFHAIMGLEGREFSWWSGVYWTVVTMSTLGFGDIVFESDLGQMYSVLVLLTGSVLILMLLPFTFIQFVYVPWQEAQRRARAPRDLPPGTTGHLILTGLEPMEEALLHRAEAAGIPYVLLVADIDVAIALHDQGYRVMYGPLDDPETYRAVRASQAAMFVTAESDTVNTNLVFTLREVTDKGLVVATASSPDSIDVLHLAGCDHVIHLGDLLGKSFARRILAPAGRSRVMSSFEDLEVAEAGAHGTPLVGSTLAELGLRAQTGASVVAIWDRGRLHMARPGLRIEESSVLVLVGRQEQLDAFDALVAEGDDHEPVADEPGQDHGHVVILGGGRVGRATARELDRAGISTTVVERLPERIHPDIAYVEGEAADLEVLREAGIERATAVVITTHEDDVNIYLTIYCRQLREDVEILGRVNVDRNLSTMHRAGADFVLSYASTGATEAWNLLREDSTVLLTEGLLVFQVPIPPDVAGRALVDLGIPDETGCSVVGIVDASGETSTRISPTQPLPEVGRLLLIGDEEAEEAFYARYLTDEDDSWLKRLARR
jgi:voltage-gated potassium channel